MSAYDTVDWRRRVFALYADVRATADPAAAHDLWRRGRDELFASHPATPLLEADRVSFRGLAVPAYDPAFRFEVEVRDAPPERVEVDTGTDGSVPFERLGVVDLPGVGSLDVWRLASYGGGLFVPVKDASAGTPGGTYGGGRYLLDTVKGADLGGRPGSLVLDLNFAYNPSCAYDPDWACPLAQPGNTVEVEVPVGERSYP
jgi:uncharacterized protein (DUF1684 family)